MSVLPIIRTSPSRRSLTAAVVVVALLASACAGVPVQAMSDTRQTIRAAERAGAEQVAPAQLTEAREGLRRAEYLLKQGEYRAARHQAEDAHANAVEALQAAQATHAAAPR